jgi:glutamyl-tRNA reductase
VCTSLISAFIQHVNKAEAERRKQKAQTNEEYIEEMFNAFSDWEPTPERAIMYRHNYVARLDHEERKSSKPNTKTPDSDSIPDNNDTIYLEDIEAFSRERNDDEDE